MTAERMCDACGVRPAVGSIRRIGPGQAPHTEYVCDVHLAERQSAGGSGFGGLGMFDDFFSRFFGGQPAPAGPSTIRARPRAEHVDVTQLFSDATRELLQVRGATIA